MKILKASAGSGKTYRLSKTYIDLLLESKDPYPYRHILAVTFTNKATAEMKSRILRDLYNHKNPKAKKMLEDILHDYSAFSVTTIDKFFQRALKAFAREIGSMDDYQIELDRQSLIRESMDRILESLTEEDKDLINWIKSSVVPTLDLGKKVEIDKSLYDIGKQLKNEDYRTVSSSLKTRGLDADYFEKSHLAALSQTCDEIISDFEAKIAPYGVEAEPGAIVSFKRTILKKEPELAAIVDDEYSDYVTAYIIKRLIFQLGLSGEFNKEFDALTREKNVMCLDESNVFLKDIIGGSDAPFVFEKIGVRYDHFLLDEFQDTSIIQWENFLPLLKEADSKGSNLIVGDIKQSIYRFRDSDWKLLGETVLEEFPNADAESLTNNWRSAQKVVQFNNSFFRFTAQKLGLESIYADVVQTPKTLDQQPGQVRVSFTDDQLAMIYDSVMEARNAGAQWGDIAILVRKNIIGKRVADYLIAQGVPIISDDSLDVHSSMAIRQLVSLLTAFESPEDKLGSYLSKELGVVYPKTYHSLVDLSEDLLRQLAQKNPNIFDGETLYIQSFMDDMLNWTSLYGNNLGMYLKYWKEKHLCISTPDSSSAIRIMTVHKSKGLEFPFVIFPFAENVGFYHNESKWCYLSPKDTGRPELTGLYPVNLQKNVIGSAFQKYRDVEENLQLIDNINVFYVTLTRAEKSLHIISEPPNKTFISGLKKGKPEYKNFSHLLYEFVNEMDDSRIGESYDYNKLLRKKEQTELEMDSCYNSTSLAGRLTPSVEALDFFSEGGVVPLDESPRVRGIILHDILSRINSPADIAAAVALARKEAQLSEEEAEQAMALLSSRVEAHPEWFADASLVLNERSIFGADGREYRPDRVVLSDDGVTIIDFKFGAPESKYLKQVERYATLYTSMGYTVKAAVVWYVETDKCELL